MYRSGPPAFPPGAFIPGPSLTRDFPLRPKAPSPRSRALPCGPGAFPSGPGVFPSGPGASHSGPGVFPSRPRPPPPQARNLPPRPRTLLSRPGFLPEIFEQIFEYVEDKSIFLSLRATCRLFCQLYTHKAFRKISVSPFSLRNIQGTLQILQHPEFSRHVQELVLNCSEKGYIPASFIAKKITSQGKTVSGVMDIIRHMGNFVHLKALRLHFHDQYVESFPIPVQSTSLNTQEASEYFEFQQEIFAALGNMVVIPRFLEFLEITSLIDGRGNVLQFGPAYPHLVRCLKCLTIRTISDAIESRKMAPWTAPRSSVWAGTVVALIGPAMNSITSLNLSSDHLAHIGSPTWLDLFFPNLTSLSVSNVLWGDTIDGRAGLEDIIVQHSATLRTLILTDCPFFFNERTQRVPPTWASSFRRIEEQMTRLTTFRFSFSGALYAHCNAMGSLIASSLNIHQTASFEHQIALYELLNAVEDRQMARAMICRY